MKNMLLMASLVTSVVAASPAAASAAEAVVTGRVRDSATGSPISGATVMYWKQPRLSPSFAGGGKAAFRNETVPFDTSVAGSTVTAELSGAFSLSLSVPGVYLACAVDRSGVYLGTCRWGGPVTIAAQENGRKEIDFVLSAAGHVRVHLKDPKALLPTDDPRGPRRLVIGIITPEGAFYDADSTASESGGRVYEMLVPLDTPLRLSLFTRDFLLADASNRAISGTDLLIPIQIAAPTSVARDAAPGANLDITFSVTGRAATSR